jgi:hypothetical protein
METKRAAFVAAIRMAGWQVRNQRRNLAGCARRAQALEDIAIIVPAALALPIDPEPVLYAVALALHDRTDPRFQV